MYRSLSADDNPRNENEIDYVYNSVKGNGGKDTSELKSAQQKIQLLEKRLAELESRLPKKYDEVKFLNYQNRKRILVRLPNDIQEFRSKLESSSRLLAALDSLDLISLTIL